MICIEPSNSPSSDTNHETSIQSQEPDLSGDGPGGKSLGAERNISGRNPNGFKGFGTTESRRSQAS